MIRIQLTIFACLLFAIQLTGQMVKVNGYVYESGNRGYLNQVDVNIVNKATGVSMKTVSSKSDGYFELELPENQVYVAYAKKQLFEKIEIEFDTKELTDGKKFLKIQMEREPGYDFEVTLAPKRESDDIPVDAIRGAWIEVYNNTTEKEVLSLRDHPDLEFNVHFDKGNHYTLMIRKEGFFTKRMEAYVNVEGCILCFEGVGSIRPGVLDNLTEGNEMGVLLTNVELDPLFNGKTLEVQNIYYDLGKSTLRPESKVALNNLATVLKDNPHIRVELGSHTDSRGTDEANQTLSNARAKAAVDYLISTCNVVRKTIVAAGYGEALITNNCGNGATCTEEEHQKNRRTELKVLNINDDKRERKTLKEIRVEEEFMKSLMNDEIETKVIHSGESPNSKKGNDTNKETKTEVKENPISKEPQKLIEGKISETKVKTVVQKDVDPSQVRSEVKKNELPGKTVAPPANTQSPTAEKIISDRKKMEKAKAERDKRLVEKAQLEKLAKEALIAEKEVVEKTAEQKIIVEEKYEEVKIVPQTAENQDATTDSRFNKLGSYTGYKVVIQFSRYPLPESHEVFKRHDDITAYKATSGSILYLIGDFATEEQADNFLEKTILLMYPGAYVINFENGRRLK